MGSVELAARPNGETALMAELGRQYESKTLIQNDFTPIPHSINAAEHCEIGGTNLSHNFCCPANADKPKADAPFCIDVRYSCKKIEYYPGSPIVPLLRILFIGIPLVCVNLLMTSSKFSIRGSFSVAEGKDQSKTE